MNTKIPDYTLRLKEQKKTSLYNLLVINLNSLLRQMLLAYSPITFFYQNPSKKLLYFE
jgi:hypothetical protein